MREIKFRNMGLQILLIIVTLGIYGIYWFYQSAEELKAIARDENASPVLWLVMLFIPFGALYSHYKYSELYEKVAADHLNKWILFILWLFFAPAVWFIVQIELNKRATANLPSQALSTF